MSGSGQPPDGLQSGPSPSSSRSSATYDPSGPQRTWEGDEDASAEIMSERYTVLEELGRGAIGVVERVYDSHLDRAVARKRLLDDRLASHRRFIREARVTASLGHPGIPPVYDLSVDDEAPYYTMQEIIGRPWKELVVAATGLEDRLGQLDVLLAVARAAAHAHERGLVHRDLKLSNVMIGSLGDVFVVDWGLCVAAGFDGPPAGTPQYMSPEQARGEPVDAGADVWALGVLLFRLLTGRAPHLAPKASEVLERAKRGVLPDVAALAPEAPPELIDMVRKATAVDREARYPNAGAFAADLKAFLQGHWVTAHEYTVRELVHRLWERHRRRLLVWVLILAALGVGVVSAVLAIRDQRDRAVAAEEQALQQLVGALEARAAATRTDRWEPQAELAAARALSMNPDLPVAWGVLVRHARTGHPTVAWSTPTPCTAVTADDERLVLDCGGRTHLAPLSPEGVIGPHTPVAGLPQAHHTYTSERTRHVLSGHLLARSDPGLATVVDLRTGEPIHSTVLSRSGIFPLAGGIRDGRPGVMMRAETDDLWWLTGKAEDEMINLGPAPTMVSLTMDGESVFVRDTYRGADHCIGKPLVCQPMVPGHDVSITAAGHGWVATGHATGGITVARVPEPGQDASTTERTRIPSDAGAYMQLLLLEEHAVGLRTDRDVDVWLLDGRPVAWLPTKGMRPVYLAARGSQLLVLGDGVQAWDLQSTAHANMPSVTGALAHRHGAPITASHDGVWFGGPEPMQGPTPIDVVKDLDTLPDGRLVWAAVRSPLTIWNPDTGGIVRHTVGASARRLVSTRGGNVLVIDYNQEIYRVTPEGETTRAKGDCWGDLARSEDRRVVLCGLDTRLQRLDPDTGDVLEVLAEHDAAIWAIGVAPDGSRAVYALRDGALVHVDLSTGTSTQHPSGHEGFVASIAYSPEGRYVATASWDQRVHVYDATDLRLLAVLEGHTGRAVEVDFSSPTALASISWDQTLWRWDLAVLDHPPEEHLARIRSEVGQPAP